MPCGAFLMTCFARYAFLDGGTLFTLAGIIGLSLPTPAFAIGSIAGKPLVETTLGLGRAKRQDMAPREINQIGKTVLNELSHFSKSFSVPQPQTPLQWQLYYAQQPLYSEPFVAYLKAKVNGIDTAFLYTRGDVPRDEHYNRRFRPSVANSMYVSYKLGFGLYGELRHLPELNVGDKFSFDCSPNDLTQGATHVEGEILEKHLFLPKSVNSIWDALNNRFSLIDGEFSSASLRRYIEEQEKIDALEEEKRTAEEQAALAARAEERARAEEQYLKIQDLERELSERRAAQEKIKIGLRKVVVDRIALRDQQILDRVQGEIFRHDFASSVVIAGAPGTGKTTTLIKRIARLINPDFLSKDEKDALPEAYLSEYFSANNWIMFTPNELLKIYLKEALAREGLAASDSHVRVWSEESKQIARRLGYLGGEGNFALTKVRVLSAITSAEMVDFLNEFRRFYTTLIQAKIDTARIIFEETAAPDKLKEIFRKRAVEIENANLDAVEKATFDVIEYLQTAKPIVQSMRGTIRVEIDSKAKDVFLATPSIVDDISAVLDRFKSEGIDSSAEPADADEDLDADDESEELPPATTDTKALVNREIKRTIRWYCQQLSKRRSVPGNTKSAEILQLIKNRLGNRIL